MNKIKQRSRSSRSSDRSSTQSGTYSTSRSRSASDSRLRSQYDSKVTDLEPIKSISSSLEVQTSRGTVRYNGICNGPDYYSRILGPTVDETILVGLKMLIKMGFALPDCTHLPSRPKVLATLESATDVASQTESSGTTSKTSQTIEIVSSVISEDVPIGFSEEKYAVDYEASISEESEISKPQSETPETESESPEPKSITTESLTNISPTLTSEEEIIEPTKTSTIVISEPTVEETLSKEEPSELSTHYSEQIVEEELVEEDQVEEPDVEAAVESVKDEEKFEDVVIEVSSKKAEKEMVEAPPEKIEEMSEEVPLEKIDDEIVEELSENIEKEISKEVSKEMSKELRLEEIKEEIPEEVVSEKLEETVSYKSEETRKSEKEMEEQEFTTEPQSTVTEEELPTEEEKSPTKIKCSKTDKSSSTASILKSSTSSKSKESSTDTYICACRIHTNGEQQNADNIRCMCPSSYCPRCETRKTTPVVVTCPFITSCMTSEGGPKEMPRNGDSTCPCTTAIIKDIMKNQNQKNNCDKGTDNRDRNIIEDQKLLCDCYTSTSSTGYTSGSDSNGNMQRGDCPAKGNVRYAITKITEYGKFTTFEVMKSTKKVPKFMPKGLEGVFVLKHKS